MNDQPRSLSIHVPVLLLALAISMFFASQIGAAKRSDDTIRWQLDNLDKQLVQLKDGQKQLAEVIGKRQDVVGQSQKVQEQYTALLNDVLDLSKSDPDAAKVVEKWKIQRSTPPEGEEKKTEDKK